MNAHVERFNRAIEERFVDYHEDSLFDDMALFNQTPCLLAPSCPTIAWVDNLRYNTFFTITSNPECGGPKS